MSKLWFLCLATLLIYVATARFLDSDPQHANIRAKQGKNAVEITTKRAPWLRWLYCNKECGKAERPHEDIIRREFPIFHEPATGMCVIACYYKPLPTTTTQKTTRWG